MITQDFLAGAVCVGIVWFCVWYTNRKPRRRREPGCRTVLTIKVMESPRGTGISVNGPNGSYRVAHALYAAACISADIICIQDEGIERGLEIINEKTLAVLRDRGEDGTEVSR